MILSRFLRTILCMWATKRNWWKIFSNRSSRHWDWLEASTWLEVLQKHQPHYYCKPSTVCDFFWHTVNSTYQLTGKRILREIILIPWLSIMKGNSIAILQLQPTKCCWVGRYMYTSKKSSTMIQKCISLCSCVIKIGKQRLLAKFIEIYQMHSWLTRNL